MTFEMYDVLEIDWRSGSGWRRYFVIRSRNDFSEAVAVVGGCPCPALPRRIARADVSFRIVSDGGEVKLSQPETVTTWDSPRRRHKP